MKVEEFKKILDKGETDTVEFKSWIKAKNQKEIISLAVDELIAFANYRRNLRQDKTTAIYRNRRF